MTNPQQDLIFALDIGTRNVIGIVGQARGEMFHVLYMVKEEHSKRAMVDGQIEDIDQVAKVVTLVKERLEEQVGHPLTRVCVAAAGRSLCMERARAMVDLPEVQTITDDYISQLEAVAIAEAEEKLSEHHKDQRFYLVGYTVAQYLLDRYPMTTIKGHNGKTMEAEVVATFLPSQVVEGLYSVVQIAGMEVASLTLEPIAALNATIPPDLRLLNLVLVDIGAGTSDIAVCRDGSVVGYTMATTAGDEITEMLMRHFLIDFRTAENLKTNLSAGDLKYVDVLGLEQSTTGQQITEAISEASKSLVKEISKEIRAINGCSPSAVFMAGGGSKLEGITGLLAEYLEIQPHRIAVAGSNYNRTVVSENYQLEDPEYATPLGIAVSAALGLINDSYHITLNGKGAKLFRSGSLTLLDILMMNGYTAADLIGRTGKNLAIMINGNKKIVRGKAAIPGILRLNGQAAVAGALVSAGDSIEFVPAIDGISATSTLQELLGDYSGKVLLNGEETAWDTPLKSGDSITTINSGISPTTLRKGPRALSVDEVKPVDAHGNPTEIPESALQRDSYLEKVMNVQQDFGALGEMNPTELGSAPVASENMPLEPMTLPELDHLEPFPPELEDEDVKIYGGDNITPIMLNQEGQEPKGEKPIFRPDAKPIFPPMDGGETIEETPLEKPQEEGEKPKEAPIAVAPTATPAVTPTATQAIPQKPEVAKEKPQPAVPPVPVQVPAPVQPPVQAPVTQAPVQTPPPAPVPPTAPQAKAEPASVVKEETAPLPKTIQEQLPVDEAPVMPTGPLPEITEQMLEKPATPAKPVKTAPQPVPMPQAPQPVPMPQAPQPVPMPQASQPVSTPAPQPVPSAHAPQPVPMAQAPQLVDQEKAQPPEQPAPPVKPQGKPKVSLTQGTVVLNGKTLELPPKADNSPYYLMDLLDKTDIDFRRVSKPILMMVNGEEGFFVQHLHEGDDVVIQEQKD